MQHSSSERLVSLAFVKLAGSEAPLLPTNGFQQPRAAIQ
jgi:hypothetical protein